jgi:dolichol-phosphate mannosyltransferase
MATKNRPQEGSFEDDRILSGTSMKVVNIIPTYNEKENIQLMLEVLGKIAQKNPQYEFETLVVDDDSPDGTSQIVKDFKKEDASVHLITGPKKGLGYALIRGYQYAMKEMKADVIIPNDCDFSFNPQRIPDLLKKINEGYDVVVASRHVGRGGTEGWSAFRKLNHWISNVLFATYVAGIKEVKDHNGNFKVIRVKGVLDQVPLEAMLQGEKVKGFGFQAYILYELSKVTNKFCEVPVIFKFRTRGEGKIGPKYLKSYLRDIFEYIKLSVLVRLDRSAQFIKFAIVGTIGFLVNALGLEIFYRLGLRPNLAAALGAEMAIISNFTLNNLWTFAKFKFKKIGKILTKFLQFNLTSFGAVVIQFVVVGIGVYFFGDWVRQIFLIISVLFFIVPYNYLMYTRFIWRTKK